MDLSSTIQDTWPLPDDAVFPLFDDHDLAFPGDTESLPVPVGQNHNQDHHAERLALDTDFSASSAFPFSQETEQTTAPLDIPCMSSGEEAPDFPQWGPMERWRNSPPQDEPAPIAAIQRAVSQLDSNANLSDMSALSTPLFGSPSVGASSASDAGTATSASSFGSAASSLPGALRRQQQHRQRRPSVRPRVRRPSPHPMRTAVLQQQQPTTAASSMQKVPRQRRFYCTFCCDSFSTKHDWTRHENSLHLQIDQWQCAPHGGSALSALTRRYHCAYCNSLDPDAAHLDGHRHFACRTGAAGGGGGAGGEGEPRAFRRKDHLVQHLQRVHGLATLPLLQGWNTGASSEGVTSRCGFCDARLRSWRERTDHLAAHFRSGLDMDRWRGDHEFEPHVKARVRNAFPPYLLGYEARSAVPFSAEGAATRDQLRQIRVAVSAARRDADLLEGEGVADGDARGRGPGQQQQQQQLYRQSRDKASPVYEGGEEAMHQHHQQQQQHQQRSPADADAGDASSREEAFGAHPYPYPYPPPPDRDCDPQTFTDLMASHLARYARSQMRDGVAPTDAMFQREARKVVYDCEDAWNQTAADSSEWLLEFKSRYNL